MKNFNIGLLIPLIFVLLAINGCSFNDKRINYDKIPIITEQVGQLKNNRISPNLFAYPKDGHIIIIGGDGNSKSPETVELYNVDNNSSKIIQEFPKDYRIEFVKQYESKQFVVTGYFDNTKDGTTPERIIYLYNHDNKTLSKSAKFIHPRKYYDVELLPNGNALIAGGLVNLRAEPREYSDVSEIEVFNPVSGQISLVAKLTEPRNSLEIVNYRNKLLLVGGSSFGKPSDTVEELDPNIWKIKKIGRLEIPRENFSHIISDNNDLILIGGDLHPRLKHYKDETNRTNLVEVLDLETMKSYIIGAKAGRNEGSIKARIYKTNKNQYLIIGAEWCSINNFKTQVKIGDASEFDCALIEKFDAGQYPGISILGTLGTSFLTTSVRYKDSIYLFDGDANGNSIRRLPIKEKVKK